MLPILETLITPKTEHTRFGYVLLTRWCIERSERRRCNLRSNSYKQVHPKNINIQRDWNEIKKLRLTNEENALWDYVGGLVGGWV